MKLLRINQSSLNQMLLDAREKSWCCGSATLKIQRGKKVNTIRIDTIYTKEGRRQTLRFNEEPVHKDNIIKKEILTHLDNQIAGVSLYLPLDSH